MHRRMKCICPCQSLCQKDTPERGRTQLCLSKQSPHFLVMGGRMCKTMCAGRWQCEQPTTPSPSTTPPASLESWEGTGRKKKCCDGAKLVIRNWRPSWDSAKVQSPVLRHLEESLPTTPCTTHASEWSFAPDEDKLRCTTPPAERWWRRPAVKSNSKAQHDNRRVEG